MSGEYLKPGSIDIDKQDAREVLPEDAILTGSENPSKLVPKQQKTEFLPEHLQNFRFPQSEYHNEILQAATEEVLHSMTYNTISMTSRLMKIYHDVGDFEESLKLFNPYNWTLQDGGSNCFGLAYATHHFTGKIWC